jgi:hypothetical protein
MDLRLIGQYGLQPTLEKHVSHRLAMESRSDCLRRPQRPFKSSLRSRIAKKCNCIFISLHRPKARFRRKFVNALRIMRRQNPISSLYTGPASLPISVSCHSRPKTNSRPLPYPCWAICQSGTSNARLCMTMPTIFSSLPRQSASPGKQCGHARAARLPLLVHERNHSTFIADRQQPPILR